MAPTGYNNLGIVLQSAGRLDAAIAAYQRAVPSPSTGHANAHSNLGVLLESQWKDRSTPRRLTGPRSSSIRDYTDAHTNLGILLNGLKRTDEAVACFCKAIDAQAAVIPEARRLLALAHCTLGEIGAAVAIFREWLAEEPDNPIALHMRAACTGRDVPARASSGFVEQHV